MAKYIIRVEQVEEPKDQKFEDTFSKGYECDGFVIVGKLGDGVQCAIHGMSTLDLASVIRGSKHLNNAAKFVCLTDKLDFLKGDNDDD